MPQSTCKFGGQRKYFRIDTGPSLAIVVLDPEYRLLHTQYIRNLRVCVYNAGAGPEINNLGRMFPTIPKHFHPITYAEAKVLAAQNGAVL